MTKKCCKTCKYGQCTFGEGLKEELQVWECNATVLIVPSCMRTTHYISPNHSCDWWNKSQEYIETDLSKRAYEFERLRKMQKGICLGKVTKNSFKIWFLQKK